MIKTLSLFILTALAEIIGCWLPYLWLRQGKSAWLIVPAAASLAAFAYLLTLHPATSGRIYAAYGGACTFPLRCCGCVLLMAWRCAQAITLARHCVLQVQPL